MLVSSLSKAQIVTQKTMKQADRARSRISRGSVSMSSREISMRIRRLATWPETSGMHRDQRSSCPCRARQ